MKFRKIDNNDIEFKYINFKINDEKNVNKLFGIIYGKLDTSKYDLLETLYSFKMQAIQNSGSSDLIKEKKINHNNMEGFEFNTSHGNGKAYSKNWYLTDNSNYIFILQVFTDNQSNLNNQEMNKFLESFRMLESK